MKKRAVITLIGLLLAATPAVAQMGTPAGTVGTMPRWECARWRCRPRVRSRLSISTNGPLTLDTGMQFTLAPSLEYTSAPAIGQEVQVTYSEQGGQKVARIIDVGGAKSPGSPK